MMNNLYNIIWVGSLINMILASINGNKIAALGWFCAAVLSIKELRD